MKTFEIPLYDNVHQKMVDGFLIEGISLDQIAKANAQWTQMKQTHREFCRKRSLPFPEHSHWNWDNKAAKSELLEVSQTRFAIVFEEEIQGLLLVEHVFRYAKLLPDKGQPILYIEYLEVAPQNLEVYSDPRQFLGIGGQLLSAAIGYSIEVGHQGRVGLHALPQAEHFYRKNGMIEFDKDPSHQYLRYYEFTAKQAKEYDSPKSK